MSCGMRKWQRVKHPLRSICTRTAAESSSQFFSAQPYSGSSVTNHHLKLRTANESINSLFDGYHGNYCYGTTSCDNPLNAGLFHVCLVATQ